MNLYYYNPVHRQIRKYVEITASQEVESRLCFVIMALSKKTNHHIMLVFCIIRPKKFNLV